MHMLCLLQSMFKTCQFECLNSICTQSPMPNKSVETVLSRRWLSVYLSNPQSFCEKCQEKWLTFSFCGILLDRIAYLCRILIESCTDRKMSLIHTFFFQWFLYNPQKTPTYFVKLDMSKFKSIILFRLVKFMVISQLL